MPSGLARRHRFHRCPQQAQRHGVDVGELNHTAGVDDEDAGHRQGVMRLAAGALQVNAEALEFLQASFVDANGNPEGLQRLGASPDGSSQT